MATVTNNAEIHVKVVGAESAKAQIGGLGASLKSLAVTAVGMFGAVKIGQMIGQTMKLAYTEAEFAAKTFRQLTAQVEHTGMAAGFTANELKKMSEGFLTDLDADEITKKLTIPLLTFKKISGEVFERTQQLALNMSEALGGDIGGAAIQLGKALENPIKGLTALNRSGVTFSETEQQIIKDLVASNKLHEAQVKILDVAEAQMGDLAAAGMTASGQLKKAWQDYLEYLGSKSASTLNGLQIGFAFALNSMTKATNSFTISQAEASIESERSWAKFVSRFTVIMSTMGKAVYLAGKSVADVVMAMDKGLRAIGSTSILKPKQSIENLKNAYLDMNNVLNGVWFGFKDLIENSTNAMSTAEYEANKFYNSRLELIKKLRAENAKIAGDGSDGGGIIQPGDVKIAEDYAKAINDLTLDIANYSKQTLDAQSSGNAMFDSLNAGFKEWADLRARIKDLFGDTAEANPFIAPVDEAWIASNIEIYTKYYQDNLNLIKESVMSETDLIEAEYTKRIADFDIYAETARTALQGLLTYQILTEQEYNAKLAELSALGVQILDKANQDKLNKLAEYNAKHESVIEEAAIKELSAMEELGADIKNMVVNGFAGAFADAIVEGENFAKSMQQLFKDLVRMILAELAKLAILGLFKSILGVATGGLSTGAGAGPLGDFFSSGGYASVGKNPLGMASNPSYMNPQINMSSTDARIDRLARIVEQNRPIVYTQVIEGVPFYNAVKRAETQALVM